MSTFIIDKEDIREDFWPLIDGIGVESFMYLVDMYGGTSMYIPKSQSIFRNKRDEKIRAEFDGYNYKALADKYNLTTRYVRVIVAPVAGKMRRMAKPNVSDI